MHLVGNHLQNADNEVPANADHTSVDTVWIVYCIGQDFMWSKRHGKHRFPLTPRRIIGINLKLSSLLQGSFHCSECELKCVSIQYDQGAAQLTKCL